MYYQTELLVLRGAILKVNLLALEEEQGVPSGEKAGWNPTPPSQLCELGQVFLLYLAGMTVGFTS